MIQPAEKYPQIFSKESLVGRWANFNILIFLFCAFYHFKQRVLSDDIRWQINLCRFPYFLPCFCISLYALGVTVASFWLPVCSFFIIISIFLSYTSYRCIQIFDLSTTFSKQDAVAKSLFIFSLLQESLHMHKEDVVSSDDSYEVLESAKSKPVDRGGQTTSKENLFRNWPLMSSITVYCVFSLHDLAYNEVYFHFAKS